ncbi:MAG: rhamnulokinase family protein [Aerococcaceae bacterium]|nr:rhamnulokinase family protein [Aerococcaceae bacterium]
MKNIKFLAVDLGASSGRLMQAIYNGQNLQLSEVHRFKNESVNVNDGLYWDILHLFREIKIGIKKATQDGIPIQSISVDTWGVDYGYLDKQGDILYNPRCYRDNRMGLYEEKFYQQISKEELFYETGVQPALINSVLQIYSDLQEKPHLRESVDRVLFIPDLINYLLSGVLQNEYTISSTSGLLNIHEQNWSDKVFERLDIPKEWFSPTVNQGQLLRKLTSRITQELKIDAFNVVAGASHDTASAVLAIPYQSQQTAAFVSCGTWSLIGVELEKPVISKEAYEANITNEGCFTGEYRLLKNSTGLWIIQELQRDWTLNGENISFAEMVELAKSVTDNQVFIDPNDMIFSSPNQMENKILEFCKRTKQTLPKTKGEIIRIVLESLAFTYRHTIEQLERVTGKQIDTINIVGGGIQNVLLCQLTADFTQRKVIAGPVEASALGNVLSQMLVQEIVTSREEVIEIVRQSEDTHVYEASNDATIEARFQRYQAMLKGEEL